MVDVPYISTLIIGWQRFPFIFGASADQGFDPQKYPLLGER